MPFKFNPTNGELDLVNSPDPFITDGTDGITAIRMHASDGSLWDFTVDSTGAWVSTAVATGALGSPIGLLLALTYAA